jgi:hypothetical protein
MGEQVLGPKLVANGAIRYVLSPLTPLLKPSVSADAQCRDPFLYLRPGTPSMEFGLVQSEKEPFAKLLYRREPRRIAGKRGPTNGQPDVLELVGNVANFRGFPHIPGQDAVLRYARTGGGHEGEVL